MPRKSGTYLYYVTSPHFDYNSAAQGKYFETMHEARTWAERQRFIGGYKIYREFIEG